MIRKNIYLAIMIIAFINSVAFGNELNSKQKFIELIKKTYANQKFPITYAFNVLSTLYNEHENTNNLMIDEPLNDQFKAFKSKQLVNIKNALYIIRNSDEFIKEMNLKKEYDLENVNEQIKNMRNYMFFLVSIIGIDLIFKIKCIYAADFIKYCFSS